MVTRRIKMRVVMKEIGITEKYPFDYVGSLRHTVAASSTRCPTVLPAPALDACLRRICFPNL